KRRRNGRDAEADALHQRIQRSIQDGVVELLGIPRLGLARADESDRVGASLFAGESCKEAATTSLEIDIAILFTPTLYPVVDLLVVQGRLDRDLELGVRTEGDTVVHAGGRVLRTDVLGEDDVHVRHRFLGNDLLADARLDEDVIL